MNRPSNPVLRYLLREYGVQVSDLKHNVPLSLNFGETARDVVENYASENPDFAKWLAEKKQE